MSVDALSVRGGAGFGRLAAAWLFLLLLALAPACAKSRVLPGDPNADEGDAGPSGRDGDGDGDDAPGDGDGDDSSGDGDGDGDTSSSGGDGDGDTSSSGGDGDGDEDPPYVDCDTPGINQPYDALSCTRLYRDIESKELGPGVHPFTPAYKLWSDGAEKHRWVYLPDGEKIDNSDPDAWVFPEGTQFFKEFQWKGKRVETRLYEKRDGRWLKTTYHWNDDDSEALRFDGGEVDVNGDTYYIPTAKECDQCHKGRAERTLGFEHVLLSLDGAEGLTMQALIDGDWLTDPPTENNPALGYLHVNCGVSCHNGNPGSEGYSSDLRLRLPPEAVDGRDPDDFEALTTTVGVDAITPRWNDSVRVVPGSPEDSLLYQLISMRDPANPKDQMPPIGSRVVDEDGIEAIEQWIRALPTP